MKYTILIVYANGDKERRTAIGNLSAICDAAYDDGALGVSAMVMQ